MDADTYAGSRHPMQSRDTVEVLEKAAAILSWDPGCRGVIMDVGCGPGNNSTRKLLTFFPEARKVLGVDSDPRMIEIAKTQNPHPNVAYELCGVEDEVIVQHYEDQIDKVLSIYSLHWTEKHLESFQNIYNILKPGGEAVILLLLKSCTTGYWKTLFNHPLWGGLIKDTLSKQPLSQHKTYDYSHYHRILNIVGFDVALCEEEVKTFAFETYQEFKNFCVPHCPATRLVPKDERKDFEESLAQACLKVCKVAEDGRIIYRYNTLLMMLRKPEH